MEHIFSGWADIVSRRTCLVFWVSLVLFIAISTGMLQAKSYEDETVIWTPAGNPTLVAKEKGEELFNGEQKFRFLSVIFESKDPEQNILNPLSL